MSTIAEKTTERDALISDLDTIVERDDFDPNGSDYVAKRDRLEELNSQLAVVAEHKQRVADSDALDKRLHRTETRERAQFTVTEPEMSPGEMFIRSDVFAGYPGRGTSSRYEVKRDRAVSLPGKLADYADVLPKPDRRTDITAPVNFTLLDLLNVIPASTNTAETVVWANTGSTTALVVAEGSGKPAVEFEPTVVSTPLETIAAYTDMTRQAIEDGPAVAARINQLLMQSVRIKAEAAAAAALIAADISAVSGSDLLAAIRYGIAEVQDQGYTPNAVLLNPTDWADLDLDVLGSTLIGPSIGRSFWGLTPVVHRAQVAGTATVGDFNMGVERHVRTGVNLYITDSNAANFVSNIFTILAEAREKTIVVRPNALIECSKTGVELS